jgi:hypothetical protein
MEAFKTCAFGCKETISIFIFPSFVLALTLYDGSTKFEILINDAFGVQNHNDRITISRLKFKKLKSLFPDSS